MSDDQCLLHEEGYFKVLTESSHIESHPVLNVVFVFNSKNEVNVLDAHSGVILRTCSLSDNAGKVQGRHLPLQDKVLFWDGKNIGLRGDYSGVLLLDTILQTPVEHNDDVVRLEMLLSEAILFQQSLQSLEEHGIECPSDVSNELLEKIKEAESNTKKSIKGQRWKIVCIELPYTSLKLVANNVVFNLKRLDRHIPALAIASAINERLTDLLAGSRVFASVNSGNFQRFLMYSEAARRQTFEKWPHMDYKWALPDQMAQAGFYHQPSVTGDDRAMCFTCNVCLVCWEKTDEPWSEHERHSPNCPFVKGEYTQNVPLAVTYATNPAVSTNGFNVVSNSDHSHAMCTSNTDGDVILWSIERQLKKMHCFKIQDVLKGFLPIEMESCNNLEITAMCVLPPSAGSDTANCVASTSKSSSTSSTAKLVDNKILIGITVERKLFIVILNIINTEKRSEPSSLSSKDVDSKIMEIVEKIEDDKDTPSSPSLKKLVEGDNFDDCCQKIESTHIKIKEYHLGSFLSEATIGSQIKSVVSNEENGALIGPTADENYKPPELECVPLRYFMINPPVENEFKISELAPTLDCKQLLVKLDKTEINSTENDECKMEVDDEDMNNVWAVYSQLQIYQLNADTVIIDTPVCSRNFGREERPVEIRLLPSAENGGRKIVGAEGEKRFIYIITADGGLELIGLNGLKTISSVFPRDEKLVSATYCKTLDRLIGCTEKGALVFYAWHESDSDSSDERGDDENLYLVSSDASLTGGEQELSVTDGMSSKGTFINKNTEESPSHSLQAHSSSGLGGENAISSPLSSVLALKNDLSLADLKTLYSLTLFDELLTPFTAEVPNCWNELVQAQKQRRHPQHLRPGDDTHLTKTWRLHNDATTWDEHTIEITLAKPASLGHIDLKFSLYQQCPNPPAIQVTLLKQNTSGFVHRMKAPHSINMAGGTSVDENIEFNLSGGDVLHENPVLSEEYLNAQSAEILAGPIELSSCLDLCDQGGLVTLTSPKLFKTRARNFILHIKTMVDPSKDGQGKTRVPVRLKGIMRLIPSFANNSSQNSTNATYSQDSTSAKHSRKNDYYIGCDWLHEISITVRSVQSCQRIANDRLQRISMLESNTFLQNLIKIACDSSSKIKQNIAMDILIWLCTIRMARFRSPKVAGRSKFKNSDNQTKCNVAYNSAEHANNLDMLTQQKECVAIFEANLTNLIEHCIIYANRSLAHKTVKAILLLSDGVRNLPADVQSRCTFESSLIDSIMQCLPKICSANHASAIRWFTLLVCGTSTNDSHSAISQGCVKLLMEVSKEISKRWNPYSSLLNSRFGLYGFPFEPELFDIDLPLMTKSNSTPNTLANIIKSNAGLVQSGTADFKKMYSIDGVEFRSFPHLIKRKSVSNQLRGLLEVEPLHFTCFAASEATRIENMDSLSSSSASNINMEEIIVTPVQNNIDSHNDGKKDVEKDNNNDDIMNNVKNILADKNFTHYKLKNVGYSIKSNGIADTLDSPPSSEKTIYGLPKHFKSVPGKYIQYFEYCEEESASEEPNTGAKTNTMQKNLNENNCDENSNIFSWHKLLVAPPKQMVVIDRIHSGARRYVVIDFGSPILLTDLVIPACDELASLFIDIWCFDEETDSVRLAITQDIGTKTLVLSDLQPPPICRFMKITIIGRYGMSATRCKIPIGSFYGHVVILENDAYADPLLRHIKTTPSNLVGQIKALNSLYEDVHCRYSLSSSKLLELLAPILNSEMSNIAHMQAYFNKQKTDEKQIDNNKIINLYEECISLQQQLNLIRSVVKQLETAINPNQPQNNQYQTLSSASRDKLRVLSECLVEILLHFSIEYGLKNILSLHMLFNMDVANVLFNNLVVSGDAHIQLATCSLLVRMCCFQSWWGDFLANIFCTLYSSQNSKIFPQDRVFFLLTYLGRKSIAMGTCSSIVIDAILKTLAKLLAPLSPRFTMSDMSSSSRSHDEEKSSIWAKSDLQLITWLLLFLSVCLDDNAEKKDKSASRWEFMSCEADFTKCRPQANTSSGKTFPRCFKKRIIQQNKYNGIQSYTDWGKKFYMLQRELPEIFMEITGKPKPKVNKSNISPKPNKDSLLDSENSFDRGLKSIKLVNILVVIRGLIGLILEMDFTCSMDLFLLTCKVIARLVSACRPSVQLSKVVTTTQLEQLVRLAVWNDQQQPWAVHAITCLLQDLLDADKNFKENNNNEASCSEISSMEGVMEAEEVYVECTKVDQIHSLVHNEQVFKQSGHQEIKYGQLPSLIECDDVDLDEFVNDINTVDSGKNLLKKDSSNHSKNSFNFFCKSVSSALDARLDYGLDTNVEIPIRRLTMISSMDLYASLPQIPTNENINTNPEVAAWPENILNTWCGPEHNSGLQSYQMFKKVFDNIFADLHLQDTWVHLEQVLHMWLSLNSELSDKPFSTGLGPGDIPKIPFGPNAVQGLLLALAWHGDIKLRTWCLGFQCLILACNSHSSLEKSNDDLYNQNIGDIIIRDENFEKMLLRFFSGFGLSTSMTTNRCAGPTICKYLHELILWLQMKAEFAESTSNIKRKLKDTLLGVVLQLVQPGGAICNQQGPIDAQSQLVRDLISIQYDKADLNVAMSIIESVSFLVYNNISNAEKIYCQRLVDANNSNNAFGNLFATVLGAENPKQNAPVSDNSLIVSLLKLSASLVQTELHRRSDEIIDVDANVSHESQTDEIKAAEQQNNNDNKIKVPCVADTVLRHFPTMKRLLGSLSHCSSSSFALLAVSLCPGNTTDITNSLSEPQTTVDAVFHLLILLCKKGSQPDLVVAPIFQYLETNSSPRNVLPRLQLSEPFLWYVLKVLETTSTVAIFTEMGGMKILCQNLVKCNRVLLNMQPGLISLIMQHMTKNTKLKFTTTPGSSSSSSKKSSQSSSKSPEGLINFAPFSSISSENSTAQPADVLIQTPIASHRRARTPAWSYLFYPNESHVDLTITLPTAILLKEIQLQPHLPTLASCPSAVAVEISRDQGIGPIPFGQPLTTVGMTCIRLKLSKPEIATSIVLRLYRPKDSSSIGLTQITILGSTIFGENTRSNGNQDFPIAEDDSFAKTSVGWIRILARCFSVATFKPDSELSRKVISAAAEYPGFIEACCTLMNVMPLSSNKAMQNLETVLLKLGGHSRELGLTLVHHLLWGTMPQTHRLCNEAVADLLYDLCTMKDNFSADRITVLIDWVLRLHQNFNEVDRTVGCRNPHSGFVKCIASILWTVYSNKMIPNLPDMITQELCNACFFWMEILEDKEQLKIAFDALICSLCYIKPEVFGQLLKRIGLISPNMVSRASMTDDRKDSERMTDDIKNAESNNCEWYQYLALQNISKLFEKPSYLHTLSMACQSTPAIYQLVDSELPKMLSCAIYEFCCSLAPEIRNLTSRSEKTGSENSMTDADKAENYQINERHGQPAIGITLVPDILDFFSECCAVGYMRDWLGKYPGSVFWKPLLELLCNCRPHDSNSEPLQQHFTRIERSTINFLSRVTSCHPNNQEHLTQILISVIRMPPKPSMPNKPIISGFTRRLVLQLLLESERILVSIKSSMPLQKKDHSLLLVNNHPSKRTSAHHLLFYLSSYTKCQDILQNCVSVYILPTLNSERPNDSAGSNISTNNQNDRKDILEMGFGLHGHGMELLSVVAGVTAKDKRLKEVKNQAAALKDKDLHPKFTKLLNDDLASQNAANIANNFQLEHPDCPNVILSGDTTISQILAMLANRGISLSTPCLTLNLVPPKNQNEEFSDKLLVKAANVEPLPSPLQRFSSCGGLSLLAHYLPTVYPDSSKNIQVQAEKEKNPQVNEWIKVGPNDEIYEDMEEIVVETGSKVPIITSVPQHSLAAFGLFLRLPAYSDVLLRDKLRAQCLLRLVLGVTGDGEGNDIYSLSVAPSLPTLPFEVFRQLLDNSPLTTDDGVLLRRKVIEVGAMHLVLNCLGIFTHQSQNYQISGPQNEITNGVKNSTNTEEQVVSDDKSHVYWAKGTGFGTGSTQQSWNVEQALLRKKSEEEHVTVLLQVLSSYINPGDRIPQNRSQDEPMCYSDANDMADELPPIFLELLKQSCLIPALSSYLRNDSVLDITRHIPLYRAILQLLRSIALSGQLVSFLQPQPGSEGTMSIAALLENMKTCVDTYAKRLKVNKKSNIKGQTQKVTINLDDGEDEGLALLIPDIQETTSLVQKAANIDSQSNHMRDMESGSVERPLSTSIEQRYLEVMKRLQFDTYEMIAECENGYRFVVSHHFESNVRMAGDRGHPSRVKRLAQETVTLSTSLPLSYSSSVFVRCDTDRLDIMKMLITGPSETPYANGCFEFDVYFPPDYPNSPMLINLETTGRHTVRFNPNLYNDGKVCLSVLNTWHGRPEEKWNAQTSSFLQVLVSIQSLILVPEPYFNEPGFERSRGTPSGTHCSREYNSNIYQACVRWAMLEQIRHPSPCFKEVIHTHFWLKRHEICSQIEGWIEELSKPQYSERSGRTISFNSMVLRRQYLQLREELAKLPVPEGLEDLDQPFNPNVTSISAMTESGQTPMPMSAQDNSPTASNSEMDENPIEPTQSAFDPSIAVIVSNIENEEDSNNVSTDNNWTSL